MTRWSFDKSLFHRADQAGMLFAGANVPLTFQRTLMPRPTIDQAIVTGLSIAANHALVSLVQESIQAGALVLMGQGGREQPHPATWSRVTLALDAAAIVAGLATQRALPSRPREPLPRAALRTSGYWLAMTGLAGEVIGLLQESRGRFRGRRATVPVVVPAATVLAVAGEIRRRRLARADSDLPADATHIAPAKALVLGAAVAGSLSGLGLGERLVADATASLAGRVLPGGAAFWRPLGHAAALVGLGALARLGVERTFSRIEGRETAVENAFDIAPLNLHVSGSDESAVAFDTISKQGRRFVWTVTAPDEIHDVLGEPAVAPPIRVYVGLASAETAEKRVALVLDELERTNAFDRGWLMVASPTGTGYVNYAAVGAFELLARGDCATVAMQYAARPSVLSLDRVGEGHKQARLLFDALRARLDALPPGARPRLVLFGESLGAWTSQDAFVDRGTTGLVDSGIDHSIWIGTPHFSKWKEQVLFDERPDVDASLIGVFNDIGEWRDRDPEDRVELRYVMVTHHDDGVALFGPEVAIRAPEWLGAVRPSSVPKGMRWMPTTTFFQLLVDMKNSANVVPGEFAARGHDYRADLVPFLHATLGFEATDEQIAAMSSWLERAERERTDWIAAHGAAGKSMSATLVEYVIKEQRAEGLDPDERFAYLLRKIADDEFGARGGASLPGAPPT